MRPDRYPSARDEAWFFMAELARRGLLSVAGLPADVRRRLETQLLAPEYRLDPAGRRQVESKVLASPISRAALSI